MSDFQTAREFAQFIKGLGFRAFVAGTMGGDGTRGYGFITDAKGTRVLSFSLSNIGSSLAGNYGPPSTESGTGWQISKDIWDLKTADDVRSALYEPAPEWTRAGPKRCGSCGQAHGTRSGWEYYTTLEQHLKQYGSSSKYEEI